MDESFFPIDKIPHPSNNKLKRENDTSIVMQRFLKGNAADWAEICAAMLLYGMVLLLFHASRAVHDEYCPLSSPFKKELIKCSNVYLTCKDEIGTLTVCEDANMIFVEQNQSCQPRKEVMDCPAEGLPTIDSSYCHDLKNGHYPIKNEHNLYFVCIDGMLLLNKCPEMQHFSSFAMNCANHSEYEINYPEKFYLLCDGNECGLYKCSEEKYFLKVKKMCSSWLPMVKFERDLRSTNINKKKFGKREIRLITSYPGWRVPSGINVVQTLPHASVPWMRRYPNLLQYPSTYTVKQNMLQPINSIKNDQVQLICQTMAYEVKALGSCTESYIECWSGKAFVRACPNAKVFYNVTRSCVDKEHNEYCAEYSSDPCRDRANGLVELEPCSGTYLICLDGKGKNAVCADGKVFYNATQSCVAKEENEYCAEYTTDPCWKRVDGLVELEPCSGTYLICHNGRGTNAVCDDGKVFYNVSQECVHKTQNEFCPEFTNNPCAGMHEVKMALENCSSTYLYCFNGEQMTLKCSEAEVFYQDSCVDKWHNPLCPDPLCPKEGVHLIELQPNSRAYLKCNSGFGAIRHCEEGEIFSHQVSKCISTSPFADADKYCFPTGSRWIDAHDCTIYYTCENNKAIGHQCPSDLGYDVKNNVCDFRHNVDACVIEDAQKLKPIVLRKFI